MFPHGAGDAVGEPPSAHDWRESPAVGELFQRAGMKGTFVLYDVAARTYRGHDETRANQRFVPASTFKIPNSLIG